MADPREAHGKALETMMRYVIATKNRGLVLSPYKLWDGSETFNFKIDGRSDSDYTGNIDDTRSVLSGQVFLNSAPVSSRNNTQKTVTLSVTEAEGAAGGMVAQDMLYDYQLLQSLRLEVELPMILEMDDKGAVDLANSWSVSGRTRHVDVRNHFLRDPKDMGLIQCRYVPGPKMTWTYS